MQCLLPAHPMDLSVLCITGQRGDWHVRTQRILFHQVRMFCLLNGHVVFPEPTQAHQSAFLSLKTGTMPLLCIHGRPSWVSLKLRNSQDWVSSTEQPSHMPFHGNAFLGLCVSSSRSVFYSEQLVVIYRTWSLGIRSQISQHRSILFSYHF